MSTSEKFTLSEEELKEFEQWRCQFFLRGGNRLLQKAAEQDNLPFARHLISEGYGVKALIEATTGDKEQDFLVKFFIAAGAPLDPEDSDYNTPLLRCARKGFTLSAEALIEAGADINKQGSCRRTALSLAARHGHHFIVEALIKAGAALDLQDSSGDTALHWAAYKDQARCAELLLTAGANPNILGSDRKTARQRAKSNNAKNVLRVFEVFERQPAALPPPEKNPANTTPDPPQSQPGGWSVINGGLPDETIVIYSAADPLSGTGITRIFDFAAGHLTTRIISPGSEASLIRETFDSVAPALMAQAKQAQKQKPGPDNGLQFT